MNTAETFYNSGIFLTLNITRTVCSTVPSALIILYKYLLSICEFCLLDWELLGGRHHFAFTLDFLMPGIELKFNI